MLLGTGLRLQSPQVHAYALSNTVPYHPKRLACPCVSTARNAPQRRKSGRLVPYAGSERSSPTEQLRAEVLDLEKERDEAIVRGKAAAEKVDRLRDASLRLLEQAKLLIQTGDETTAREYLEDKALVLDALAKAQERANVNFQLATRLDEHAGRRQADLIAILSSSGRGPTLASRPADPGPATGVLQSSRPEPEPEAQRPPPLTPHMPAQEVAQSRDVDSAFLDMERASLERLIQAGSASRSSSEPTFAEPASISKRLAGAAASSSSDWPSWWANGEAVAQEHMQQHARSHPITRPEAHQAAESATIVLSRAARQRSCTTEDMLMLLHWSRGAHAGGVELPLPSSLQATVRQELLRNFALACLTARQTGDALLGYAPTRVPALHEHCATPLSAIAAQALVVGAAHMLQLPAAAAVSPVNKALTDRVCSLLADAATGKPQDTGATLARQAERSAAQLQQVLATFPPSPNSAEMERLQRKIDRQTQLTRHWRHAFGALYAKRDTQLSTTRLLYTMLKLDKVD